MNFLVQLFIRRILSLLVFFLNLLFAQPDAALNVLAILLYKGVSSVQEVEVGELLLLHHVYAAVKHDGSTTNLDDDAASANVLTCSKRDDFNCH
jgi:hypothetical protein